MISSSFRKQCGLKQNMLIISLQIKSITLSQYSNAVRNKVLNKR